MNFLTPEEVAREAREALKNAPETPAEHFDRLVHRGFINSRGELTRLLGGDAEPDNVGVPQPANRKGAGE